MQDGFPFAIYRYGDVLRFEFPGHFADRLEHGLDVAGDGLHVIRDLLRIVDDLHGECDRSGNFEAREAGFGGRDLRGFDAFDALEMCVEFLGNVARLDAGAGFELEVQRQVRHLVALLELIGRIVPTNSNADAPVAAARSRRHVATRYPASIEPPAFGEGRSS